MKNGKFERKKTSRPFDRLPPSPRLWRAGTTGGQARRGEGVVNGK